LPFNTLSPFTMSAMRKSFRIAIGGQSPAVAESSFRLDIVIGRRADLVSVADDEWLLITTDTRLITAARVKLLYRVTVAREGDSHAVLH
jgi:hypothetical protein